MGCDIHLYIEYCERPDDPDAYWYSFGHIHPGRDYGMFATLAGVRGDDPAIDARGIPDKLGFDSEWDYYITVNDNYKEAEQYCSTETADKWVGSGSSEDKIIELRDGSTIRKVTNPDWHTPSWLTTAEFEQAIILYEEREKGKPGPSYIAVLNAMEALPNARVVFWFDN